MRAFAHFERSQYLLEQHPHPVEPLFDPRQPLAEIA
jgi:hypothetical protein